MTQNASSPAERRPARHRRRTIRSLVRQLGVIAADLARLRAEEDDDRDTRRRTDDTRRKLLSGQAILNRVIRRVGKTRWLRRLMDAGLTRAADRSLFRLEDDGPLIPEEDWPGWPARSTDTQADASRIRAPAARRRARIDYLEGKQKALQAQLLQLMKEDEPEREARNNQRKILVGAVFLELSRWKPRVCRWLRKLLDDAYTEARDRELFQLEGDGPIVREEDQAGLRPPRRRAAKTRVSDDGPDAAAAAKAPVPSPASPSAARGEHPGSSTAEGAASTPDPDLDADGANESRVQEPIPGWRPRRIKSDSETGGETEWGAALEGCAVVAALPAELRGRTITVTDSGERSWTTTITAVVSRDQRSILVRNTGRPRAEERVDTSVFSST